MTFHKIDFLIAEVFKNEGLKYLSPSFLNTLNANRPAGNINILPT